MPEIRLKKLEDEMDKAFDQLKANLPPPRDVRQEVRGLFARFQIGEIPIEDLREQVLIEIENLIAAQAW